MEAGEGGGGGGTGWLEEPGFLSVAFPCLLPYQTRSRPQKRDRLTVTGYTPDHCHSGEAEGLRARESTDTVCGPASPLSAAAQSAASRLVHKLHVTLYCARFFLSFNTFIP